MMILKEKGGSANFDHVGGRKKMLDCEAEVRVGRAGCQRHNKELQLFAPADQACAEGWEWSWGDGSTGFLDNLLWAPHLQSAPNPDYRAHLLSLPLLKSHVIRKSAFLDLGSMWMECTPKHAMEKLKIVTESNSTASVFKDVGSKWQRNDCFHLK